jgi:class 3 adenylate cyclase
MAMKKENTNWSNVLWAVIILLIPYCWATWHFSAVLEEKEKKNVSLAESSLMSEMNAFRQSLSNKSILERIFNETSLQLGLIQEKSDGQFKVESDPGYYKNDTAKKIRSFLEEKWGISPEYIVSVGFQGQNINHSAKNEYAGEDVFRIARLTRLIAYFVADVADFKLAETKEFSDNVLKFSFAGKQVSLDDNRNRVNSLLRYFFSGMSEFPRGRGICFEAATSRVGGNKVYFYADSFQTEKKFIGGFFIIMPSDQLTHEFVVKNAVNQGDKRFNRGLKEFSSDLKGKFVESKHDFACYSSLPTNFMTDYPEQFLNPNPEKISNFLLKVSISKKDLNREIIACRKRMNLINRLFILLIFASSIFCGLYGFPWEPGLRGSFLLIAGIIVMIPLALTSYFSDLLLENIENSGQKEVEIESDSKLFEIKSYIDDLRIRRQLLSIKVKKEICDYLYFNKNSLNGFTASERIPHVLVDDTAYHDITGTAKILSAHEKNKVPRRMSKLIAVKCLNNLGVLDLSIADNRRELELVGLADGFLEEISRNYLEGMNLALESQDTKDIAEINNVHKMNYSLIPDRTQNGAPVFAIAFRHLFSISRFGNCFEQLGRNPSFLLDYDSPFLTHRFSLAERSVEGPIVKSYPQNSREDTGLKLLLDRAVNSTSSGKISKSSGKSRTVSRWVYNENSQVLIAGVSKFAPDQWIAWIAGFFPAVLSIFSLISVFLIRDFTGELLIKPISGFIGFFKRIRNGNFKVRVEMEKTDEFSMLADSLNHMTRALDERENLRKFVSERLFENIKKNHQLSDSFIEKAEMAVLASDIRGFTSLTEKHEPEEIVLTLNEYFTHMCRAIVENKGVIERFVGDAVIAIFYQDDKLEHHSLRAVKAAIAMRENLKKLNEQRKEQNRFILENGIGIVSDQALTAISGSNTGRKVFSVMGKAVKKAEELESLTAEFSLSKILVCANTASNCQEKIRFNELAERQTIFEVIYETKQG